MREEDVIVRAMDQNRDKVLPRHRRSRGIIGAAIARGAARSGWRVVVNYARAADAAEAVVREIEGAGGSALALQGDVAREEDVLATFGEIDRRFGRIDGLVNNAGIVGKLGRLDQIETADLRRVFEVNTFGAFLCAREAVKRMSTRHGGRGGAIVNMSSAAASIGSAGEFVHYAASKAALNAMTLGLAREVAREGIRVNAVEPGLAETDMHEAVGGSARDRAAGWPPSPSDGRPRRGGDRRSGALSASDAASYGHRGRAEGRRGR
jgi:NAD(P)-dependent dehydrogenase (short-subunit alcohol dehydrogenase family)